MAAGLDRAGAFDPYLTRLAEWRDGDRPALRGRADFELDHVLETWRQTLRATQ
jgi:hypothetical protein